MKHPSQSTHSFGQRGQSLVEVALFFPIFVILLAGVIEVSQLIITQNRVSNAARVGARFGANGGDDEGMLTSALNSITQTLGQESSQWDVWTIRGEVNELGDDFDQWSFEHVYGISNTTIYSDINESNIRDRVLAELRTEGDAVTAGIRIVGTLMIYDVNSIIGLDALPFVAEINSIQDLNVMRIVGITHQNSEGCDAFPIAVHEGIRSISEANYPAARDFGPGSPTPTYASFFDHRSNMPMLRDDGQQAPPFLNDFPPPIGSIFKIQNGFGSGNFGWLRWNQGRPNDANTLQDSLTWPGNSKNYEPTTGGSGLPGWGRVKGYVEPGDVTDSSMHIGDLVAATTGNVNSSGNRQALRDLIEEGAVINVIVWNSASQTGNYGEYTISGFAMFRLHGFNLTGSDSWILAEFRGWNTNCGQE